MKMQAPAAPEPVKPPDPIRIPQTSDPDVAQSIRRKMMDAFGQKRGRSAADLGGGAGTDKGGGAYARSELG